MKTGVMTIDDDEGDKDTEAIAKGKVIPSNVPSMTPFVSKKVNSNKDAIKHGITMKIWRKKVDNEVRRDKVVEHEFKGHISIESCS
ncbi:unnamed protein product [Dovyalis caffra]|uniref:Uncharacterized protein n=1 Tax=Dovyalis caffra TaxID=77055 RepID=A0AAV1R4V6_9ROSI|nr:unnamed protein product [Dovyalis caffra]